MEDQHQESTDYADFTDFLSGWLVIMTATMPMSPAILSILITIFVLIVTMMLFPLRFPLPVFEFFVRPYSASRRPRHRLEIRHVLGRQSERVERTHVELTGRRNSQAILEGAHRERCSGPVPAVDPALIISATPQLTLHFCDDARVCPSRRPFIRRTNESAARLNPPIRLAK